MRIEQGVPRFRKAIAVTLERRLGEKVCVDEVDNGRIKTGIRGYLFHSWAKAAKHPGLAVTSWVIDGSPAGVSIPFGELDGLHPRVPVKEQPASLEDIIPDPSVFANYAGVEAKDEVADPLEQYRHQGDLTKCESYEEASKLVGGQPALSKLGVVEKDKWSDVQQQIVKNKWADCGLLGVHNQPICS